MIKNVVFRNFRNYSTCEIEVQEKNNVLIGPNGQGKTNFLEAIYYMSYMRSFRKSSDRELIPHGGEHYYFKGEFENEQADIIEVGYDKKVKNIKIDGEKQKSILNSVGKINVILFSDIDIELLHSGPLARRTYLDTTLSIVDENYLYALYNYKKVLKMRNAAIRNYLDRKGNENSVKAWDPGLLKYGCELIKKRMEFVSEVSLICKDIYPVFTKGKLDMKLSYSTSIDLNKDIQYSFNEQLSKNWSTDIKKGSTTIGPHRDEILIKDKNRTLKKYTSKGQARAAVLILRLAQMKYIEKEKSCKSILLLDDVLLDLDNENKQNFLTILGNERQCFFTATSNKEVIDIDAAFYNVNSGNITISK